jgi:hypothetical protein
MQPRATGKDRLLPGSNGLGSAFCSLFQVADFSPFSGSFRFFSALAVGVLGDERFDDLGNLLLLTPGQFADGLENAPCFAGRPAAALLGCLAEKKLDRDVESGGNLFDLLRAQCDRVSFPYGISLLGDAQPFRHLSLGESGSFPGGVQPLAELRPRLFRWSACLHGMIIRSSRRGYWKCLHRYYH